MDQYEEQKAANEAAQQLKEADEQTWESYLANNIMGTYKGRAFIHTLFYKHGLDKDCYVVDSFDQTAYNAGLQKAAKLMKKAAISGSFDNYYLMVKEASQRVEKGKEK